MKKKLIIPLIQLLFLSTAFCQPELGGFCQDKSGNIYCSRSFNNVIDLGNDNLITATDSFNIFIARYNNKGVCDWVSKFGNKNAQNVSAIGCDAVGNTFVTGTFSSTVRFRKITISASKSKTYPSSNFYLVKLNPSGDPLWAKASKNKGRDDGCELTCDEFGNVYVAGTFDTEFECDGNLVSSKGKTDMFILKLSSQGVVQWIKNYGDQEENSCNAIFLSGDKLYASTTIPNSKGYKALLLCLNTSNGEVAWTKEVGSSRGSIEAITVGQDKSILITGSVESRNTEDARELIVAKYLPDGTDVWTRKFTGGFPLGRAIVTDQNNVIYVTGEFSDSLRMDKRNVGGYPKEDIFVAKIAPNGAVQILLSGGNSKSDKGYYLEFVNNTIVLGGSFTNGLNFGKITIKGSDNTIFVANFDRTKNSIEELKPLVNEVVGREATPVTDLYGKLLLGAGPNKAFLIDHPLHLEDQNGSILKRTVTDEKGDFSFKNVNATGAMNLVIENNNTIKENEEIFLATQTGIIIDKTTMKEGKLKFPIIEAVVTKLKEMEEEDMAPKFEAFLGNGGKEFFITERILYEAGSWSIPLESQPYLNKIVQYMKKSSRVRLEISAHTDAIGDDEFNKKLSVMRAQEVKDFLVQKSVSATRITVIGHGEEKIINRCVEGITCSESEHAFNRRTEFRFYLGTGL